MEHSLFRPYSDMKPHENQRVQFSKNITLLFTLKQWPLLCFALGASDSEVVHVQVPGGRGGAGQVGGVPTTVLGAAHTGPSACADCTVQAPALGHRLLQPHQAAAHQGRARHPDEAVLVKPDLTLAINLRHGDWRLF